VEVARKLHIPRVLIPIAAGAGSCLGMLAAPQRADRAWSKPQLLADVDWHQVARNFATLRSEAEIELAAAGAGEVEWRIGAEMRYFGQGAEIPVSIPFETVDSATSKLLRGTFESEYERLYGRLVPNAAPQVITWRLVGRAPTNGHHFKWGDDRVNTTPAAPAFRRIYLPLKSDYAEVKVYDRYSLAPGARLQAPLILEERESTIVVPVTSEVTILADLTVSVTIKEFD
jgi:N-methylhydantoinase A